MFNYFILALAIAGEVAATSALKASQGFTQVSASLVVVVGYAVAFYCLALALKTIPVGIAYATWSGVGIILVSGVSWVIYGQKLDLWAVIGFGLIIAGVLVVNLLSKTASH